MSNTNLFDIHEHFFIIDSNRLSDVTTKLYGYTIIDDIIVEQASGIGNAQPSAEGAFVYVCADQPETITITQDFIGSFGLYLYREDEYFALSNSFAYLTDYLKKSRKLTLNRDYINHFIISGLSPTSYSETPINEIEYLDRSAVVSIHVPTRALSISLVDYHENTLSPTSKEGLEVLDRWYNKWTRRLRNMERSHEPIQFDLSGGFDSRITFTLAVGSGIDMTDVYVYSIDDDLHTHVEDFEIATEISKFYGFPLNKVPKQDYVNYTLEDAINISMYLKMGFHTQMHPKTKLFSPKRHAFSGNAGEAVRNSHWGISQKEYIDEVVAFARPYGAAAAKEFTDSTVALLNLAYEKTRAKFRGFGREIQPEDYTMYFYRETRCRHHFGRDLVENYFSGAIRHAPLLDPDLHMLKLHDEDCTDKNLLVTIIMDRYQKDLLSFKFDGGRSIDANTLAYARKLNAQYPYIAPDQKTEPDLCMGTSRTLPESSNPVLSPNDFYDHFRTLFNTKAVRNTFLSLYDEDTCNRLYRDVNNRKYQPLMKAYTVVAICKFYEDTLFSQDSFNRSVGDGFLAKVNGASYEENDTLLQHPYLSNYVTARMDIQSIGSAENDLALVVSSDKTAKTSKPKWMTNGGGYTIQSVKGTLDCTFRCIGSGNVKIELRGADVRDPDGKRIPFWIDYHQLTVNGTPLLEAPRSAWHDQPIRFHLDVTDGDMVQLFVEWTPHNEQTLPLPLPATISVNTKTPTESAPIDAATSAAPKATLIQKIMRRLKG